jgi:hypothetical protein
MRHELVIEAFSQNHPHEQQQQPHLQHFKARATSAGKVPQKLLLVKRREMYRYTDRGRDIIVY